MKLFLDFLTKRPQNPDVVLVKLHPESENETKLLDENIDTETIELYYQKAVQEKLPNHALLSVIDKSQWPYAATLSIRKIGELGH